jgi:hypothetical protein
MGQADLWFSLFFVSAVVLAAVWRPLILRVPEQTVSAEKYPSFTFEDIWTDEEWASLMDFVKARGSFRPASADHTGRFDEVGESNYSSVVYLEDGSAHCTHPVLVPSTDGKRCIFPSRMDVAKHYLSTGGVSGRKELYERAVSRLQSFQMFKVDGDLQQLETLDALFKSEKYVEKAKEVCAGYDIIDPFQLGIIINLPGQEVPIHFDAPWFTEYTRTDVPQWLLVAMSESRLFEDQKLHQVQGVAYLHKWVNEETDGGGFFWWPKGNGGEMIHHKCKFNSALILNGCIIPHGVYPYQPTRDTPELPLLTKSSQVELAYVGEDKWELRDLQQDEASEHRVIQNYQTSDLRMSLVWRSRCFKTQEEFEHFQTLDRSDSTPEKVMAILEKDLVKRGVLAEDHNLNVLELSLLIMDTYVKYPMDDKSLMPYNLCVLPHTLPPAYNALKGPLTKALTWLGCSN